jgi:excinuclease ABC subunit A
MNQQRDLHTDDVKRLVKVLHKIVDEGATMVVIEHNLDVIKNADHIIDLRSRWWTYGWRNRCFRHTRRSCEVKESYTGQYLKNALK